MDREDAIDRMVGLVRRFVDPANWESPEEMRDDLRRALRDYDDAKPPTPKEKP